MILKAVVHSRRGGVPTDHARFLRLWRTVDHFFGDESGTSLMRSGEIFGLGDRVVLGVGVSPFVALLCRLSLVRGGSILGPWSRCMRRESSGKNSP